MGAVIFPAGILLVIHGHHKGVALTLCLGVLILVFCSCCLPASYLWIRRWKKRQRQRELAARALHSATKEKAAFDNAVTTDDHPRDEAENYVNTWIFIVYVTLYLVLRLRARSFMNIYSLVWIFIILFYFIVDILLVSHVNVLLFHWYSFNTCEYVLFSWIFIHFIWIFIAWCYCKSLLRLF